MYSTREAMRTKISTLFPRIIPRGKGGEFPLSTHPIRGVEVENSQLGYNLENDVQKVRSLTGSFEIDDS
jgi:hypothetical protein